MHTAVKLMKRSVPLAASIALLGSGFSTASAAVTSTSPPSGLVAYSTNCGEWQYLPALPTVSIRSCVQRALNNFQNYDRARIEIKNTLGDVILTDVAVNLYDKSSSGALSKIAGTTYPSVYAPGAGQITAFHGSWINEGILDDGSKEYGQVSVYEGVFKVIAPKSPEVN
ncbi:hypothetical protein PV371_38775 [Streptomyces sp. TX20-6-3]|uniref:hypothetical protein n=1 Tax=Streptomyces sp. TX20-6-3 TaxID=3028705 RepID=UPI0029B5F095|nr:hypothetical protein [Streptomyces sp. TX20-6-3]MDX2565456.1 hypothetical protein [Streptomyces sp. TX20-6-3]